MPEIPVDIESNRPVIAANLEELRYLVFQGMKGDTGDSAYELAVSLGFEGTEQEWLDSLQGADGADGKNYGIVVDGSVDDVLELKSQELNIGVPTKTSDLTNDSGFISLMITEQPEDVAAANQAVISFYVVAVGKTPFTYQWQISDDGGTTWTNSSVTTTRYRTTLTTEKYGRKVRCVVTDGNGQSVTSRAATMSLYPFATVATSGSYNDLSDKPTIPAGLPAVTALDSGSVLKVDSNGEWGLGTDETGGSAASGWEPLTSEVFNFVAPADVGISASEAYYNADTGMVRFNLVCFLSTSGSGLGRFRVYFDESFYYTPSSSGYGSNISSLYYQAYPIGMATAVSVVSGGSASACVLFDNTTGAAASQRGFVDITATISDGTARAYVSGMYYTEKLPSTGGES